MILIRARYESVLLNSCKPSLTVNVVVRRKKALGLLGFLLFLYSAPSKAMLITRVLSEDTGLEFYPQVALQA